MAIRYVKMFGGRSYQHRYQGLGRHFVPGVPVRLLHRSLGQGGVAWSSRPGGYTDYSSTRWEIGLPCYRSVARGFGILGCLAWQREAEHAKGILVSPFYPRLHIAQLEALELTYPEHESQFGKLRKSFDEHLTSPLNVTRAVAMKGYQELQHPPEELKR